MVNSLDILEPSIRKWYPGEVKRSSRNEITVRRKKYAVAWIHSGVIEGTWLYTVTSSLTCTEISRHMINLHDPELDIEIIKRTIDKARRTEMLCLRSWPIMIFVVLVLTMITYFVVTRL